MRQARAVSLPNETLHIEELKFWLKIMQEHTKFIRGGLPAEAGDFIDASKEFHRAFTSLVQKAERLKSIKQSSGFIQEVSGVMGEFDRYQRKILSERLSGSMGGTHFPLFLDHMLREAKSFSDFLNCAQEEKNAARMISHTREVVVWLRFMADHARLLSHYIDPSERRLGRVAADFAGLFDNLALEARDLSSMLYCHRGEVRAFYRFLLDIRMDVQRLRDFHKMAEDLIADCRLLGIVSFELAAHMKREAEHCLLRIALLEKELIKHDPDAFQDDADGDLWLEPERVDSEPEDAEASEAAAEEAMDALPEEAPLAAEMQGWREEILLPNMKPEAVSEPVVAIFPMAAAEETVIPAAPPEVAEQMVADARNASLPTQQKAPEAPEAPEAALSPKEKVYAKASDYKYMPSQASGMAPGERLSTQRSRRRMPRALGKKEK